MVGVSSIYKGEKNLEKLEEKYGENLPNACSNRAEVGASYATQPDARTNSQWTTTRFIISHYIPLSDCHDHFDAIMGELAKMIVVPETSFPKPPAPRMGASHSFSSPSQASKALFDAIDKHGK